MGSDMSLRHEVEEELEWDPRLDSRDIGVAVKDGVVALTGHVSSYAARCAAEQAAQSVVGVQGIANDIVVRLPLESTRTDPEIAAIAVMTLKHNVTVPSEDIKVIVRDGGISLEGHVDHWFQKNAAQATLSTLQGIKGIANNLVIRQQTSQPGVQAKIREAFRRRALADCGKVAVGCDGGVVTLEGQVHSAQERQQVVSAAWQGPGVMQVVDHLKVVP